jgi:hypothetical protein
MNVPSPIQMTPAPVTAGAIPWYKSPQQIGLVTTAVSAAVALFPKVGVWLGLSSPSEVANAVTNVFSFIAVVAPIVGSIVRANSKEQPLTLTASEATVHPATRAIVAVQAAMREAGIPTARAVQTQIECADAAAAVAPPPVPVVIAPPPPAPVPVAPAVPVQAAQPKLNADDVGAIANALYLKMVQAQQARQASEHSIPTAKVPSIQPEPPK